MSVYPAGEVGVCGEYGIKEVQEYEGGAAAAAEGGQKLSTRYGGGGRGEPLELRPAIRQGGRLGGIRMDGKGVVPAAAGSA